MKIPHNVYQEKEILKLPQEKLRHLCYEVSRLISENPKTMVQYSPLRILKFMHDGITIVITDKESNKLIGFVKTYRWGSHQGRIYLEIGSLIVDKKYRGHGIGHFLVREALLYAKNLHQNAYVFAVVRLINQPSLHLFKSIGAIEKPIPQFLGIPDKRVVPSVGFDLTNLITSE